MTPDNLNLFITGFQPILLLKFAFCFSLAMYIVFAFIVVRQINLMTSAINFSLGWLLKVISTLHLIGAIFVLFLALTTL